MRKNSTTEIHLWLQGGCTMESIYRSRRQKLAELLPEGAGALIFSGEEIPLGEPEIIGWIAQYLNEQYQN